MGTSSAPSGTAPAPHPTGKAAAEDAAYQAHALAHSPSRRERARERLDNYMDTPAILAALLMLLLAYSQFSGRLGTPWQGAPAVLFWIVWGLFVIEFLVKFALAVDRGDYVRHHKLDLLSALLPVFALLRIAESIRTTPLPPPHLAILKRRQLDKLLLISAVMILIFATLELLFESGAKDANITTFGQALYWAATNVTTVSSQFYPVTKGGELISFLIMVYAVVIFGYLASSLASALIGGDAQQAADNAQQAAGQARSASQGARDATAQAHQAGSDGHAGGSGQSAAPPPAQGGPQGAGRQQRARDAAEGGQTVQLTPQEVEALRSLLQRLSAGDGAAR